MSNSVAAGRQLARRAVRYQAAAVLATALACLLLGWKAAAAVALGGGALLAGGMASARWSLGGGVVSAGTAIARMLAGLLMKWLVVIGAFLLGLVAWRLPALPLLLGVLAALIAQFLAAIRR